MPDPVTLPDEIGLWPLYVYTNGRTFRRAENAEVLAHPAVVALTAERDRLREELERERMRLAACGVAALQDTPESVKERLAPGHPYYSGSYAYVCRTVDEVIRLREELENNKWEKYRVVPDLEARCARLQAVLNAERGEKGPEGWEYRGPSLWCHGGSQAPGIGANVVRGRPGARWGWHVWDDTRGIDAHGTAPTALEAMEAADRAAEGREG